MSPNEDFRKELQRRLLENHEMPISKDDDLLVLAAVMHELMTLTQEQLHERQRSVLLAHEDAAQRAAALVEQAAKKSLGGKVDQASAAAVAQVMTNLEETSNELRKSAKQAQTYAMAANRAVWVCTVMTIVTIAVAVFAILN